MNIAQVETESVGLLDTKSTQAKLTIECHVSLGLYAHEIEVVVEIVGIEGELSGAGEVEALQFGLGSAETERRVVRAAVWLLRSIPIEID